MIRLVETPRQEQDLFGLCRGSAFGCKLLAVAKAYGFRRDFARFWTGGGAAYCLLDGELSVAGSPADIPEAREFLLMLGPGRVFCERGLAAKLGAAPYRQGAVMAKDLPLCKPEAFPAPRLGDVHALLTACGMPISFEPFYLDMSHRLRHGAALAIGEYAGGELAGCAVVSAVTGSGAVLSALAVKEGCRGRGIGTGLMAALERALPGRRLYLFRESGKNREFYERLGFAGAGRWAQTGY